MAIDEVPAPVQQQQQQQQRVCVSLQPSPSDPANTVQLTLVVVTVALPAEQEKGRGQVPSEGKGSKQALVGHRYAWTRPHEAAMRGWPAKLFLFCPVKMDLVLIK
jgi:hypothetical protein